MDMKKVRGANLGNWLVLEKWMEPDLFEETGTEDETWLVRKMDPTALADRMKKHRDTYVTEEAFAALSSHGVNLVRIPVPYFIFGDRPPFIGCVEYLDRAFEWAQKYGIQIMIDLHTCPGSQNGYDNGGLTGVCKWCKDPVEVEFELTVLERLAERYGSHPSLYGIEVLNEPISWLVYITAPSTGKAEDKEEAKGSGHVPMSFLKQFYRDAYRRLRAILPEEKVIVFHDGFRLGAWKDFFVKEGMKNVALDTHIYVFAMEHFVPIHQPWVYQIYINSQRKLVEKAARYTPVIVGEWCISNKYALAAKTEEEKSRRFKELARKQLKAWSVSAGFIYWNYQLRRDLNIHMDEEWKDSWDLRRCWKEGWIPDFKKKEKRKV